MIHRTRGDEPYDERDISISGNKANERLTNLKGPLEKDGDSTTILAKDILQGNYESIIGRSPQIIEVLKQIDKIANTIAKVLIRGETGTGKELIARALHQNSDRSSSKIVCINCAAIPDLLLESELFGHERGAFTDAKVRELENALICFWRKTILLEHLPEEILAYGETHINVPTGNRVSEKPYTVNLPLGTTLKAVEEVFIRDTLAWQNGNRTRASRILGISVRTLQNRLKDYKQSSSL